MVQGRVVFFCILSVIQTFLVMFGDTAGASCEYRTYYRLNFVSHLNSDVKKVKILEPEVLAHDQSDWIICKTAT